MKILFTGKGGKSGSWQMRGEQLGAALGADIRPMQGSAGYDVTVVVKRTPPELVSRLQGKWVWDIVDAYPQPHAYQWDRIEAVTWLRRKIAELRPTAIIWPNEKMREDCDTRLPGIVLPHHHRVGIKPNPIRPKVRVVGYEGAAAYLGWWRPMLEEECAKRGWAFVVNPESLADVDIIIRALIAAPLPHVTAVPTPSRSSSRGLQQCLPGCGRILAPYRAATPAAQPPGIRVGGDPIPRCGSTIQDPFCRKGSNSTSSESHLSGEPTGKHPAVL